MLKKFEKIESTVNGLIEKLVALFFRLLHTILPKKLFNFINKTKAKIKNTKQRVVGWFILSIMKLQTKVLELFHQSKNIKTNLEKLNPAERIKTKALNTKKFLLTTPLKTHFKFFYSLINKFSNFYKKLSATQLAMTFTAFVMLFTGSYGVYQSSKDIIQKEFPSRAPASVQEYDVRPDYRLYIRKTVKFYNMSLPITVEQIGKIRKVVFEFSVMTSTRWARYYLQNNEVQLKDYFYTTVEPVVSDFPLKEEGKLVLKEKIRVEINNFLRESGVEGEVEEVRLGFVNAY